jgi:lysozyme family protein
VKLTARAIALNKAKYLEVTANVSPAIPWQFVGFTHYMECNLSFLKHLHNGDLLVNRTIREPAGRPTMGTPPFRWEASAADALKYQKLDKVKDWSIGAILRRLEEYNGMGYWKYHNMYTPYLWSGTNHYVKGKYTEVLKDPHDKKKGYKVAWNPELVSKQIGCAPLLKLLEL